MRSQIATLILSEMPPQVTEGVRMYGNYKVALEGVQREIRRREIALAHRKAWIIDPAACDTTFTVGACYFTGFRIMREIAKLKQIRYDLNDCINKLYQE